MTCLAAAAAAPVSVSDLPLIEIPNSTPGDSFAIVVSGDGGWADIDRSLASHLAGKNVPVVGWNSLKYFWEQRTPERMSADLDRVIRHYCEAWGRKKAVVMGYSMGAEVIPFMVSRLPAASLQRVSGMTLIGPSTTATFEFHLPQWLGDWASTKGMPISPEMQKIRGPRILCIDTEKRKDSLCRQLDPANYAPGELDLQFLTGGHHFAGEKKTMFIMIGKKMGLE